MRTSEVDILIVPGLFDSGPDHWQSRWERTLPTARRVQQDDWRDPSPDSWITRIVSAAAETSKPAVLVGHSLGCIAIAHAAACLPAGGVAGAFLVAPADVDSVAAWPDVEGKQLHAMAARFAPVPKTPLPFPSTLVASTNDPFCAFEQARAIACAWGSKLIDAGPCGHINADAGFGPWPDGVLRFGAFLKQLG